MIRSGFTQLGKRLSAQEKRDFARRLEVSVLCINVSGQEFRMAAFERTAALVTSLAPLSELILIDLDSVHSRNTVLLDEFPWMRIIIPTRTISLTAAIALGMKEALGQRVLLVDTSAAVAFFDFPSALRAFREDRRLFAIGPVIVADDEKECPVLLGASLKNGRLCLTESVPTMPAASLGLRRFYGIYDREKVLFLGAPPEGLPTEWAGLEWFVSAWSRGWRTKVDPAHCVYAPGDWSLSLLPGPGFLERVGFFRIEIAFLRRHCRSKEQVRARRQSIFFKALTNILRLDFALFFAGLTHRRFRARSRDSMCSLQDVLRMLSAQSSRETEEKHACARTEAEVASAETGSELVDEIGADDEMGQAAGLAGMLAQEPAAADKAIGIESDVLAQEHESDELGQAAGLAGMLDSVSARKNPKNRPAPDQDGGVP